MFFSKKKKKQQERDEIDIREFQTCVKNLWNGIHALDEKTQIILRNNDVSHDTALFIMRSTEDLLSILSMYKRSKYFHDYMSPSIDSASKLLKTIIFKQEEAARNLLMLHENRKMTKRQLKKGTDEGYVEDDISEDVSAELFKMGLLISEQVFQMRIGYREYRSTLNMLRAVVSMDYIAIISGINIPLLYEDYESLVHNHIKREIHFDTEEIKKELVKIKEETS